MREALERVYVRKNPPLGAAPMYAPAPFAALIHDLRAWPQTSQEQARRNAMVAATACAQRRVERQEVEDYFASLDRPAEPDSAKVRAT